MSLALLTGCSESKLSGDYSLSLSGQVALEEPVQNVFIEVIDDSPEYPGKVWASQSSVDGRFQLQFVTDSFGPFRIRASDLAMHRPEESRAFYANGAVDDTIATLGAQDALETMFYFEIRRDVVFDNVAVNALTTLASKTATAYIRKGVKWEDAVQTAHKRWASYIHPDAVDLRFVSTLPIATDLTQPLIDHVSRRVALFHGGLARLGANWSWRATAGARTAAGIPSVRVVTLLNRDLQEGVLNGRNAEGDIAVASGFGETLSADTLRGHLGDAIRLWIGNIDFGDGSVRAQSTGYTRSQVLNQLGFLQHIANSTSPLFSGVPGGLDFDGPRVVSCTPIVENSIISGWLEVDCLLEDANDVEFWELSIDETNLLPVSGGGSSVQATLGVVSLPDGAHQLNVDATDVLGNHVLNQLPFTVANEGPRFEVEVLNDKVHDGGFLVGGDDFSGRVDFGFLIESRHAGVGIEHSELRIEFDADNAEGCTGGDIPLGTFEGNTQAVLGPVSLEVGVDCNGVATITGYSRDTEDNETPYGPVELMVDTLEPRWGWYRGHIGRSSG